MVTQEAPLIVLDSKYAMCMANNGKDTKHTKGLKYYADMNDAPVTDLLR